MYKTPITKKRREGPLLSETFPPKKSRFTFLAIFLSRSFCFFCQIRENYLPGYLFLLNVTNRDKTPTLGERTLRRTLRERPGVRNAGRPVFGAALVTNLTFNLP